MALRHGLGANGPPPNTFREESRMMAWLSRYFACLVLMLPCTSVVGGETADAEVARLVKQLGSSDFRIRDAASQRLKRIAEGLLDALDNAGTSGDPEVRRRAELIVANIETRFRDELLCLVGHTGTVWTVSVSADGKRLLTSGGSE